jgi:hypothetical protein
MVCHGEELVFAAQFDEPQAMPLDRFLKVSVGQEGDLMSTLLKCDGNAQHRMHIACTTNGREDEMHARYSLRFPLGQRFLRQWVAMASGMALSCSHCIFLFHDPLECQVCRRRSRANQWQRPCCPDHVSALVRHREPDKANPVMPP